MVRDDYLNVFLMKQGGQLLRSEMAFQKPAGIRPSPDQSMAADFRALGL